MAATQQCGSIIQVAFKLFCPRSSSSLIQGPGFHLDFDSQPRGNVVGLLEENVHDDDVQSEEDAKDDAIISRVLVLDV